MIKNLFTLTILFAIIVFIVHKGWHTNIYHFLDSQKGTANTIVDKTKEVARDLTKKDTIIIQKVSP